MSDSTESERAAVDLIDAIRSTARRAAETDDALDAMKYTQSALNAANALLTLKGAQQG